MRNSFVVTVVSVALLVVFCAMAGFVLERRRDRMATFVNAVVLAGLIIPPAVVPTIYVLQESPPVQLAVGLVLVEVAYLAPFSIILFRPSWRSTTRRPAIRPQLDEAAMIDGCTGLSLFFRRHLPVAPAGHDHRDRHRVGGDLQRLRQPAVLPARARRQRDHGRQLTPLQLPEPVQHPVATCVHGRAADHRPPADHVHHLQPQDRRRPHRRAWRRGAATRHRSLRDRRLDRRADHGDASPETAPERPIRFRRQFTVRPGLRRARLYASALGVYTVECNGSPARRRRARPRLDGVPPSTPLPDVRRHRRDRATATTCSA